MKTDITEDTPLLKVEDVATLLNVPVRWVYDAAIRPRNPLPSMKVGHYRRFDKAAVLAWLSEQQS